MSFTHGFAPRCISSEKLYANDKNSFLSSLFLFTWTFFPRWATQMTATRCVDGVAKMLNKADVERLRHSSLRSKVDQAEQLGKISVFVCVLTPSAFFSLL